MKLEQTTLNQLKKLVNSDIEQSDKHYADKIEPDYLKHQQTLISDKKLYDEMYPKLAQTVSNIVAFDLHDTVAGIVPGIVKAVLGSDEVLRFKGFGKEDGAKAEKLQKLENWQIQEQNEGFLTIDQWVKDGCAFRIGIAKLTWKKESDEEEFEQQLDVLNPEDQMMLNDLYSDDKVSKMKVDPVGNGTLVTAEGKRKVLKENRPVFDNVPLNAIRWSPNTKNFYEPDFIAQINRINADGLRRLAKANPEVFFNVEEAIARAHGVDYTLFEQHIDDPNTFLVPLDDPRKEFEMWECYGKYDINDDGLLEDAILHVVEGEIVGAQVNEVGQHPFLAWSPNPDAYRVMPLVGLPDLVAETQHVKTALKKQIVHNIAVTNDPRHFVDENTVNLDDMAEGARDVRVDVPPNGNIGNYVQPFPVEQIHPTTFPMLEYEQGELETHTGITKYAQGLDAKGLNDTATGINIITNNSEQKKEYILRCFVELGMKPLARLLTKYNQMYIDQETVERLLNTEIEVTMDDLDGKFDIQVAAGVGTGTKMQEQQNMQMLINMYGQAIPAGIADIGHAAFAFKKLIESLGYKNTDDFVFSPEQVRQMQQQKAPQQPDIKESLSIKFSDLPVMAQIQVLQAHGIQISPQDYIQEAKIKAQMEGMYGTGAGPMGGSQVKGNPTGPISGGGAMPNSPMGQAQMPTPGGNSLPFPPA